MHYTTRRFWSCYAALPENVNPPAIALTNSSKSIPTTHLYTSKKLANTGQFELGKVIELWVQKSTKEFSGSGLVLMQNTTT
jgi:hypothetical protein